MKKSTFSQYAIDNSSIIFLSTIRKDHTNTYRFTMTLTEEICPETLQTAVDRIYRRFPTVIAGFYPGFFHYFQVPAKTAPLVQKDPGCLLTMSKEEIRSCAFRVYYSGKTIAIEAFHALADGFGAIAVFTTLVAEYLRLKHGIHIPVSQPLLDVEQSPMIQELTDSYLDYEQGDPRKLPIRQAYQLPKDETLRETIRTTKLVFPTQMLLDASHKHGVSITTLLSSAMAASIMELQQRRAASKLHPVRIMVPVDLRRMFPSKTLRNFVLYVLPTLEPEDREKSLQEILHSFTRQLHTQIEQSRFASVMAYNVRAQRSWYFRMIPLRLKCLAMRFVHRYLGESTSSVTMSNLGNVTLPEEMRPFVEHMDVCLTPRFASPYNCAVLSCKGLLTINISRFPRHRELEDIFCRNLSTLLHREVSCP